MPIDSLDELTAATELKQRLDSLRTYAGRWAEAVAYECALIRALKVDLSLAAQTELDVRLAAAQTIVDAAIKSGLVTQEQIDARLASSTPSFP